PPWTTIDQVRGAGWVMALTVPQAARRTSEASASMERRPRCTAISARLQDAAADLVEFDRLEQGLEVALAEALVALALDELEEDRPDRVLAEDLQQKPLAF